MGWDGIAVVARAASGGSLTEVVRRTGGHQLQVTPWLHCSLLRGLGQVSQPFCASASLIQRIVGDLPMMGWQG